MDSLRAMKLCFVNSKSDASQCLGSTNRNDDLEAGFGNTGNTEMPGLGRRLAESTRGRNTYMVKCSSAQRRLVWASIISVVLSAVIVLVSVAPLISTNISLRKQIAQNDMQRTVASWRTTGSETQAAAHIPRDFSRNTIPIPCLSHNDELRKVPLYDALVAGCTGVEADTYLTDDTLLVGHSTDSLTSARSLQSLYIEPLVSILDDKNPPIASQNTSTATAPSNLTTTSAPWKGVFAKDPAVSLTLLIDIKSDGNVTLPVVIEQLEPLRSRGYLTYFDGSAVIPGPITVVGSGNTPFDLLIANTTYRDIFFDAPLEKLSGEEASSKASLYTSDNSYYASVNFDIAVGKVRHGRLDPQQLEAISEQVGAATAKGLKARYWNTPARSDGLRDYIWDVLESKGVGMLSVDDIKDASRRNWGAEKTGSERR